MNRAAFIAETVLSLGLNIALRRLGGNPWMIWGLLALNELRGAAVVYRFGGIAWRAVHG
jgi:hypothetical protein